MNWQAINFDWNQVRAFLATVEEGSLSAAARALGLTQPTLGRQVSALEERLGVTLFERSGRNLILTPSGMELADHVRAMGEAATRLSLTATGQATSVEGLVRITASEIYSAYVLPKVLTELRARYPGIVIEVVATNSLSDLRRREADIALRNAEPTEGDLIARKLRDETGGLYATPGLLAAAGPVRRVEDLAAVPFVGFGEMDEYLAALKRKNLPVSDASFVAHSSNHLVHWELTRAGLGLGVNAWSVGDLHADVERVLPDEIMFSFPLWLVAPQELKTSRRVRLVYDFLAERLAGRGRVKSA